MKDIVVGCAAGKVDDEVVLYVKLNMMEFVCKFTKMVMK